MKRARLTVLIGAFLFSITLVGSRAVGGDSKASMTFCKDIAAIFYKASRRGTR